MTEDQKVAEERAKDLEKRIQAFNEKLLPLLGEYDLGLGAEPLYARTPQGHYVTVARPTLFDVSKPAEKEEKKAEQAPAPSGLESSKN